MEISASFLLFRKMTEFSTQRRYPIARSWVSFPRSPPFFWKDTDGGIKRRRDIFLSGPLPFTRFDMKERR